MLGIHKNICSQYNLQGDIINVILSLKHFSFYFIGEVKFSSNYLHGRNDSQPINILLLALPKDIWRVLFILGKLLKGLDLK